MIVTRPRQEVGAGRGRAVEHRLVRALVAQPAGEAPDEGRVSGRPARRDGVPGDGGRTLPARDRTADRLRAAVADGGRGLGPWRRLTASSAAGRTACPSPRIRAHTPEIMGIGSRGLVALSRPRRPAEPPSLLSLTTAPSPEERADAPVGRSAIARPRSPTSAPAARGGRARLGASRPSHKRRPGGRTGAGRAPDGRRRQPLRHHPSARPRAERPRPPLSRSASHSQRARSAARPGPRGSSAAARPAPRLPCHPGRLASPIAGRRRALAQPEARRSASSATESRPREGALGGPGREVI